MGFLKATHLEIDNPNCSLGLSKFVAASGDQVFVFLVWESWMIQLDIHRKSVSQSELGPTHSLSQRCTVGASKPYSYWFDLKENLNFFILLQLQLKLKIFDQEKERAILNLYLHLHITEVQWVYTNTHIIQTGRALAALVARMRIIFELSKSVYLFS